MCFPYFTQAFNINKVVLFSIKNKGLRGRSITINLNEFSEAINNNNQSEMSITSGTEVLVRNKDEDVLLVLSYSLEK